MLLSFIGIWAVGQDAVIPKAAPKAVIQDIRAGNGPKVVLGDLVTVHFIAATPKGKEIANSEKRGLPYKFVIGAPESPRYLQAAVEGMKAGGVRRVVLPPELAFGPKGAKPILAPNTDLVLHLRLLKVEKPPVKAGQPGQR